MPHTSILMLITHIHYEEAVIHHRHLDSQSSVTLLFFTHDFIRHIFNLSDFFLLSTNSEKIPGNKGEKLEYSPQN